MNIYLRNHIDIFIKLVKTRLITTIPQLIDKIINTHIWTFCTLVIFGYVMQSFGLGHDYGIFQFAGIFATLGLFEVYGSVAEAVMDFDGDRSIAYYLTLPTRPIVVLFSAAAAYAFVGIVLSFVILPCGKLILWNSFALSNVSWIKLIIINVVSNIFFGIFTLAIAAHVKTMSKISNVWMRFMFPLWFLGGFQFSWQAVNNIFPSLGYLMLANPILYIMEGTRAALLGQGGFLSWWVCVGMILVFSMLLSVYAYRAMKKFLDFV